MDPVINKCSYTASCQADPYAFIVGSIDYDTPLDFFYDGWKTYNPTVTVYCEHHTIEYNRYLTIGLENRYFATVAYPYNTEYLLSFLKKDDNYLKVFYNFNEAILYHQKLLDLKILS